MFFSRTPEEPVEVTGSSRNAGGGAATSVPASASAAASASTGEWETKGAAGLGAISSMSAECTPLKHRYDSCFNLWFKDYLAIGDDQIQDQQRRSQTASTASSSTNGASTKKKSGWFSDSSSSSTSTQASSIADSDVEGRKNAIMQRYERDCAQLFKDYQACIKKAVTERGLDDLIRQARKENPFPFDHERRSDARANNPPFPFPAAKD
ncbi:uncharacterized protein PAN0_050d6431 [Moesziomyces antarcticus]|uniref:Uncharacterized protein n=2 Tax=Pseudozyma antarctica TaxID=84753 RepID=A0A081CNE9_PSEA2|nr:uncharacterized protein PAN0_050d6431 [Moesziomyces antarcticus]GAK68195.1 conserved hypothetical protein [Moesziomyces antarcticus]SPO49222.1 uncharacterized protein PSANT_06913 [Moesziomyces antarcticus]